MNARIVLRYLETLCLHGCSVYSLLEELPPKAQGRVGSHVFEECVLLEEALVSINYSGAQISNDLGVFVTVLN